MNKTQVLKNAAGGAIAFLASTIAYSGTPLWTLIPLSPTTFELTPTSINRVSYQVTNQSHKLHTLALTPIAGVTQETTGINTCKSRFVLGYHESCILKLLVKGSTMTGHIFGGPKVCEVGSALQCYQPSQANSLHITKLTSNHHTVGGSLIGLKGSITLQNNDTDNLTQSIDGPFEFSKALLSGSPYSVTVLNKPTSQTCSVSNGYGVIADTNITNVRVNCSNASYTLSAQAPNLAAGQTVEVENTQNRDTLTLSQTSAVAFGTPLALGADYNVVVRRNPTNQVCTPFNNSGSIMGNTTVQINCDFDSYPVGGTVNGLIAGTLRLQINGGDTAVISKNGPYTFTQNIANNTSYTVTIAKQPAGQVCTLSNATGTVTNNKVTNVNASCRAVETTLSTSLTELALSIKGITEYGVSNNPASGKARRLEFTNTGTRSALNVTAQIGNLPAGTMVSQNTCTGVTLGVGVSCMVEINPDSTASYSSGITPCTANGGAAPNPSVVTVTATNAAAVSSNVVILGYDCQYKGGHVFAFDDNPSPTASVAGKVAYVYSYINALWWSGPTRTDTILMIDETSTTSAPSPTTPSYPAGYPAPTPCNGALDGKCNSSNITSFYNHAGLPLGIYPAGLCLTREPGAEWYSPALCEQSYGLANTAALCGTMAAPTLQNLTVLSAFGPASGNRSFYWSSTENSANPNAQAWRTSYIPGFGQSTQVKNSPPPLDIVCIKLI